MKEDNEMEIFNIYHIEQYNKMKIFENLVDRNN
jgi:hypothetical protein